MDGERQKWAAKAAAVKRKHKAELSHQLLLHRANWKFVTRFNAMEACLLNEGQELPSATLKQMDNAWNKVKLGRFGLAKDFE